MKNKAKARKKSERLNFVYPWQCRHYGVYSEVRIFIEASEKWENLITVRSRGDIRAKELAELVCRLVNEYQSNKSMLLKAMQALEDCLLDSRLTFSSEQVIERAVADIKKAV